MRYGSAKYCIYTIMSWRHGGAKYCIFCHEDMVMILTVCCYRCCYYCLLSRGNLMVLLILVNRFMC